METLEIISGYDKVQSDQSIKSSTEDSQSEYGDDEVPDVNIDELVHVPDRNVSTPFVELFFI